MNATAAAGAERVLTPLELYRDDGPLSRALGAALGAAVRLPPVALLVAGALPLAAAIVVEGDGASDLLVSATVAWAVLAGGVSSGRPHTDNLRWAVPPVLRGTEYAALLWIAALAGGSALPAAFALLAALAFRHYDIPYRLRYQGASPPRRVGDMAGGWDGRLLVAYALLLLGAVPAGFFALAALFGGVFVAESVASWARVQRSRQLAVYEEEEGEEE